MKNKKFMARIIAVALAASTIMGNVVNVDAAAATPKLNATSKTVKVGKTTTLTVKKVKGIKKITKVTWKSSKSKVATVKKTSSLGAKVTAKAVGKSIIAASVKFKNNKGKSASKALKCVVKVTANNIATTQESAAPAESTQPSATPATTAVAQESATPAASTQPVESAPASAEPSAEPTVTPVPTPTPTPFELPKEALKDYADFNVGTVISYSGKNCFRDPKFSALAAQQFDLISFENEMKGYSLMDTEASKNSPDGMPVCKFEQADEMVQWCVDNGLKVRGHVLIWENSMADSFFYVGYDKANGLVDAETIKARMKSYCTQVVTHFEEKFPGTVIAWDVVNEAIDANAKDRDEATGLYLYTTGKFYQILGGDYIKYAFQYAKEAVAEAKKINPESNILLYYNDFNTFQSPKTDRICELIDYLNADTKLLDCMGMEGYILTYWPGVNEIRKALDKYASKDVKIGVNELTIRLNPAESKNKEEVTDSDISYHANKYGELFEVYKEFNEENPGVLTNISIWGLTDHPELLSEKDKPQGERNYDYDVYGTHSGLFDEKYDPKEAFDNVIAVLKEK